jgi:membrane-associated phospholipid phosphatase
MLRTTQSIVSPRPRAAFAGALLGAWLLAWPSPGAAQPRKETADVTPPPAPPAAKKHRPPKHRGKKPRGDEVDVVTAAGAVEGPPPRRATFTPSKGDRVAWNPAWRPFELFDYVSTGIFLAGSFATLAIPPTEGQWVEANDFDKEVRLLMRGEDDSERERARDASDILLIFSINQILVDTFIVTWWGHDAGTVAYEMALMNVQTLAFNSAINGLVSGLTSRQRPYVEELCQGESDTELEDCRSSKRYRSFYSGHTSTTFAIAGLTCMHHAHLPLYGSAAADALACVTSLGVAGATGVTRIVGDQHYASDVLLGAGIGALSGTLMPYFLHYRTGDMPERPKPGEVSIEVLPTPTGLFVSGGF